MKKIMRIGLIALCILAMGLVLAGCDFGFNRNTNTAEYTVNFYNGVDVETPIRTEKVKKDGTVTPPEVSRDGYAFSAWAIDNDASKPFTAETKVTGDLDVFAMWKKRVTVSFDLNGGTGTAEDIETLAGETITLPSEEGFLKGKFGLAGWTDGSENYLPGAEYTVGSKNVVFTARWSSVLVATFTKGNAEGEPPAPIESATSIVLPDEGGLTKEGYTFAGWLCDGELYEAGEEFVLQGNTTFVAAFAGEYKLTLQNEHGEEAVQTGVSGSPYTLPEPEKAEGLLFEGWASDTKLYRAGDVYFFGYDDETLTASWTDKAKVSFVDWDGTVFQTEEVDLGQPFSALSLPITAIDEWAGWTDREGNPFDPSTVLSDNLTLYASYTYPTENNRFFHFAETEGGYLIESVDYFGSITELTFPATYRGKPVLGSKDPSTNFTYDFLVEATNTSIGGSKNHLQTVHLPSTFVVLGDHLFSNCRLLERVDVGSAKLERIGYHTFHYCVRLTEFRVPDSVKELSGDSFLGCGRIERYIVGEGNANYSSDENGVLYNKNKTELVAYPTGNARTSFEVPASVVTVGGYAFDHRAQQNDSSFDQEAFRLQTVTFAGDRVNEIGTYAFAYLRGSVVLPGSITAIGERAFDSARASIRFTDGLLSVGNEAFYGYRGTSITLPSSVKDIGEAAFRDASSLASVTFDGGCGVENIGDYAFYGCATLSSFPMSDVLKNIGSYAFANTGAMNLGKISFPSSLVSIGDHAFTGNNSLTSVNFAGGEALQSIGTAAFMNCKGLTTVTFGGDTPNLRELSLQCFYLCTSLETVQLPEGLQSLGTQVFAGEENNVNGQTQGYTETKLKSIEIPGTVVSIYGNAFAYLTHLERVTFREGTADLTIGAAFIACLSLNTFEIPARTVKMYPRMFEEVGSIEHFSSESESYPIENGVLYEKESGTVLWGTPDEEGVLTIPEGAKSVAEYAFYKNHEIGELRLPASMERIEQRAFSQVVNLTKVTQEEGGAVKFIGDFAFSGYPSVAAEFHDLQMKLSEFPFREGLEEIGTGAFENNIGFTAIELPTTYYKTTADDGSNTGGFAFADCVNITKFTFKGTGTTRPAEERTAVLRAGFLAGCTSLEELIVEKGTHINTLASTMFSRAYQNKTVYLYEDAVVRAAANAFVGESAQKPTQVTVYVPENLLDTYRSNGTWSAASFSNAEITFTALPAEIA